MLGYFVEIIPAVLSKLHPTCREKLLEKKKVAKQFCVVTFFGFCAELFHFFGDLASARLYKLLSTCPKECEYFVFDVNVFIV